MSLLLVAPLLSLVSVESVRAETLAQVAHPDGDGYWMLGADGEVYAFGEAADLGDATNLNSTRGFAELVPTPTGLGYWILTRWGSLYEFGDAADMPSARPGRADDDNFTAGAATATGQGVWAFTEDGVVVVVGDAEHYGDLSGIQLDGPVVAASVTPTGKGYYMIGSDGGVFAFGDAAFHGSVRGALAGRLPDQPVVGIVPVDGGYWLVAADGGVFAFGAPFRGSVPAVLPPGARLDEPINGMVAFGNGYLLSAADGGVFNFSDRVFLGSLGGVDLAAPIIGVAARPSPTTGFELSQVVYDPSPDSPLLFSTQMAPNPYGVRGVEVFGDRAGTGRTTVTPTGARVTGLDGTTVDISLDADGRFAGAVSDDGSTMTVVGQTATTITLQIIDTAGASATAILPLGSEPVPVATTGGGSTPAKNLGANELVVWKADTGIVRHVITNNDGSELSPAVPDGAIAACNSNHFAYTCRARWTGASFDIAHGAVVSATTFETVQDCDNANVAIGGTALVGGIGLSGAALFAAEGAAIAGPPGFLIGAGLGVIGFFVQYDCGGMQVAEVVGRDVFDAIERSEIQATVKVAYSDSFWQFDNPVSTTFRTTAQNLGDRRTVATLQVNAAREEPFQIERVSLSDSTPDTDQEVTVSVTMRGGRPTNFSGDAADSIVIDWGDGSTSRGTVGYGDHELSRTRTARHTYTAPGSRTVTVRVENDPSVTGGRNKDSASTSVSVTEPIDTTSGAYVIQTWASVIWNTSRSCLGLRGTVPTGVTAEVRSVGFVQSTLRNWHEGNLDFLANLELGKWYSHDKMYESYDIVAIASFDDFDEAQAFVEAYRAANPSLTHESTRTVPVDCQSVLDNPAGA